MAKTTIQYSDYFAQAIQRMREDGLLLVTADAAGKLQRDDYRLGRHRRDMGRPVFIVLVRPSRHTYSRLEEVGEFTVNVPPPELAAAVSLCGTVSGPDCDKFQEAGLTLTARAGRCGPRSSRSAWCTTSAGPFIGMTWSPRRWPRRFSTMSYPAGGFHRVYFGEIVAAYADEDAAKRLHEPAGVGGAGRPRRILEWELRCRNANLRNGTHRARSGPGLHGHVGVLRPRR